MAISNTSPNIVCYKPIPNHHHSYLVFNSIY